MGHGCFKTYHFEIPRNASLICVHYHATADTVIHKLLFCLSWAAERTSLFQRLRLDVHTTPLSGRLCASLSQISARLSAQEGADQVGASGPAKAKDSFSSSLSGV